MLLSSAYFEQCHVQRASSEKARATKKKSALARACAGYWLPLRCCINVCCHAAAGSGLCVCTFPALSSSAQAILRGRPFSRSQAPERDDEVRWARCLLCAGGFASGKSQASLVLLAVPARVAECPSAGQAPPRLDQPGPGA